MAHGIQVTFDCVDAPAQARFWAAALRYVVQPPPEGFETWEAFGRAMGIPEEDFDKVSACVDPDGRGPRLFFQRVPEGKEAKNRVHLDVNVGKAAVDAEVERLVTAGATKVREVDQGYQRWVVMADPEGNEFCVQ
ncbi:MAG TPA: VOC family protein [Frankiaceae bacterium]|jgi:hypothetical protein|nr:VOC family protein [Frankiaceae bacterium]